LKTSKISSPKASSVVLVGFGASVAGPEHMRLGRPNQDAWILRKAFGSFSAAVADGLGTAKYGNVGAKAACVAAMEAFRIARRAGAMPSRLSIGVLRAAWHQFIADWGAENCGTTCLTCSINHYGELFAAQIGDGIIVIRRSDGRINILPRKAKEFQNFTETIGSQSAQNWSVISDFLQSGDAIFMASDGIADDLEPSMIGDFISHLLSEYLPLRSATRTSRIRSALRNWPTRHHRDDKTFVILARTS
jgi:serine/threonine protein phosphatase PrpC